MTAVALGYAKFHNQVLSYFPELPGSRTLQIKLGKKNPAHNDSLPTAVAKAALPVVAVAGIAFGTDLLGKIKFAQGAVTLVAKGVAIAAAWAVSIPVVGMAVSGVFTVARVNTKEGFSMKNIARVVGPVLAGVVAFVFAPAKLLALIPVKPLIGRIVAGVAATAITSIALNWLFNRADVAAKKDADKKAAAAAAARADADAAAQADAAAAAAAQPAAAAVDKSDTSAADLAAAKEKAAAAAKQKNQDTLKANARFNAAKTALADAQKKHDTAKTAFDTAAKTGGEKNVASDIKEARDATSAKLAAAQKELAEAEADVKKLAA